MREISLRKGTKNEVYFPTDEKAKTNWVLATFCLDFHFVEPVFEWKNNHFNPALTRLLTRRGTLKRFHSLSTLQSRFNPSQLLIVSSRYCIFVLRRLLPVLWTEWDEANPRLWWEAGSDAKGEVIKFLWCHQVWVLLLFCLVPFVEATLTFSPCGMFDVA